jgi:hypothetical protein
VRPYLGRMNIDLPGFSRRKFLSKYSLQRRSGARLVNLGDGDLLPRLLDQRGSQSRDAGGGIQTFTKVPSPRVWGLKVSAGRSLSTLSSVISRTRKGFPSSLASTRSKKPRSASTTRSY